MKAHLKSSLFIAILILTGCKMVYFERPQPIDGKSLSYFPKSIRGNWNSELNTLSINKTTMAQISFEIIKIPTSELDTSSYYVRNENTIYKFNEDHLEYKGNFKIENDTAVIHKQLETEEHTLGQNIILKKVKKHLFLNVREDNGMWQVMLVDKDSEENVFFRLLNNEKLIETLGADNLKEITSPTLDLDSEDSRDYYYYSNLHNEDMIRLIDAGAFSDTLIKLTTDNKWQTPLFTE